MRLTCPNCDAQYEVDDRAIPEGGRDVQCSNCGHGWYQYRDRAVAAAPVAEPAPEPAPVAEPEPTHEDEDPAPAVAAAPEHHLPAPAEPAAPAAPAPAAGLPDWEDGYDEDYDDADEEDADLTPPPLSRPAVHAPAFADRPAARDIGFDDENEDDEPPMVTSAAPVAARRRALDDNVRAVLQEEARRETEARKAEGAPIETQTELGLEVAATPVSFAPTPAPANRAAEAAAALGPSIMAKMKGYDAELEAAELEEEEARHSAGRSARRDLLPDIEEINSTLRASSDRGGEGAANMAHLSSPEEQKRGFRLGFGLILLIAVVLVGIYVSAPAIAQKLPAAKPFLIQYVDAVNGLRAGLDTLIQGALGKLGKG